MESASQTLRLMAQRKGVEVIGALQRTIAYASVADGGTGYSLVTAAAHGLKKDQTIFFSSGVGYINNTYKVFKVLTVNTFLIEKAFGATAAGNIQLTAALNGAGFICSDAAVAFAEFIPYDSRIDPATVIAKTYVAGEEINIPFSKIRLSAGNGTSVRQDPRAVLDYTNR